MEMVETLKEGLKRGYSIKLPAEELETRIQDKLKEAQPGIEMKGFRKGKVPLPLLRKQFGSRLLGEAMQEAVDGALRNHFDESGEKPVNEPDVKFTNQEGWKEGQDVELEMNYEALPEIPDADLAAISLERLIVKAEEGDIEEALSKLADQAKSFENRRKGTKAKSGDQVLMDFKGMIDGEAFEGGSAEDHALELGSNSFIPGFEDQLIGAKEGEEVTVKVTFPENYNAKNLAGKEAEFLCTIKGVKSPVKAEIDDELAKKFGADDLDALKSRISEQLEGEYKGASRAVMKRALLDQLDESVTFELPTSLVEQEAKQIAHQLFHEENPDHEGHDHGDIEVKENHTKLAERRVRLGLLLAEIGNRAELKVSDQELSSAMIQQARNYPGQEQQFLEFMQKNPQMVQQVRAPLFEEKVVDYAFELAQISEKEVSKDDLKKAVDALEEE